MKLASSALERLGMHSLQTHLILVVLEKSPDASQQISQQPMAQPF